MHTAYASGGISSRKLLQLGLKISIENMPSVIFLKPPTMPDSLYHRRTGTTLEDFTVITPAAGLPLDVVRQYNLKVRELLEAENANLTLDVDRLEKNIALDSLVRRVSKTQTERSLFPQ